MANLTRNLRCKICLCEEREEIDTLLKQKMPRDKIALKFPHLKLNSGNFHRHMKHLSSDDYEHKIKLDNAKKAIQKICEDGDEKSFEYVETLVPELEEMTFFLIELCYQNINSCLDGEISARVVNDSINSLSKVVDIINVLTGLGQRASIDAAIEKLVSSGYKVINPCTVQIEETEKQSPFVDVKYEDFLVWKSQNERYIKAEKSS